MIDPSTPLTVTLTARQWNNALAAMNHGMEALAAIMAEMQRQCMAQQAAPPFVRPNGQDVEERAS